MKLNVGCGDRHIEVYINIDHRTCGDRIDDVFTLKEYKPNTVDRIVARHVLEHACYDRSEIILSRWYQLLKKGGELYVCVPKLEYVFEHIKNYLQGGTTDWEWMNSRIFGQGPISRAMYGLDQFDDPMGVYKYESIMHKAIFDRKTLRRMLLKVGFNVVKDQPARDKEFALLAIK